MLKGTRILLTVPWIVLVDDLGEFDHADFLSNYCVVGPIFLAA